MEIPQQVQDKLKCSECDELLSCGPVYLLHETGETICGRCSQQSEDSTENRDRTRNEPYEATAALLAFPCAHAARGCPEKHSFTLGQPSHELNCKFRPFICPIEPRGSCDWIGSWPDFKEHCDEKHAPNVLQNKSEIPRPNLTTFNLHTYLISYFNFLFLLHVKVCVTSGKLFHSLRMFGNSELLDKYSYSLEIESNETKIKKTGSVLPTDSMTLQEASANSISINNMLDILDGKYEELKFIITIQSLITFNCLNCSKTIEDISDLKFCEECLGTVIKCKFNQNGCMFVDINRLKCEKHELLFCEYQTKCYWCEVNFVGGSFIEHVTSENSSHKAISSDINTVFRVTHNVNSKRKFILISTNIGILICRYYLSNCNFSLGLYTSLPSHELKNLKCSVELTDPRTTYTKLLTPQIDYSAWSDWTINEDMNNFLSWHEIGIDMKINIF